MRTFYIQTSSVIGKRGRIMVQKFIVLAETQGEAEQKAAFAAVDPTHCRVTRSEEVTDIKAV